MSELSSADELLVEEAHRLIEARSEGNRHTVASAIRTKSGATVAAVNMYHFTGGPCAEVVALGSAISNGLTDLESIVAVGDEGRGVITPCGRCRQVLYDYEPDLTVIVAVGSVLKLVPLAELLPLPGPSRRERPND